MDLRDAIDDIDHLHADVRLDPRHSDRFLRRLQDWWPFIARECRRLLGTQHPPPDYVAGVTTYAGTLEHCRQVGRAAVDDFRLSNRDGVFLHLSRNRQSRTPQDDFWLSIGFTGDGNPASPG